MHACMEQSAQLWTPTLSRPKLITNTNELPEAVVLEDEGAMAGFVGLLRQLGDLAQLAVEVFDGLHDQATAVSARARGLTLGARRLEAELTLVEERLLRRRSARPCFLQQQDVAVACSNSVFSSGIQSEGLCRFAGHGLDLRRASARPVNHGVIVVGGTKPRSIAEHIRRCRGPPELSTLDKYDAGGEGACLKRYTDPSFFRAHSAKHELFLQETKPKLQSSHKCSKFKTDALLDMLRQLKYRHIIRRIIQRISFHSFHNQDSSQDEASEADVLSSLDSPETSNTKVPCPSVGPARSGHGSLQMQLLLMRLTSYKKPMLMDLPAMVQTRPTRMPTLRQMLVVPLSTSSPRGSKARRGSSLSGRIVIL
ncbi:hypothetical protein CFC21_021567 [Triticum aestivum]|uniref:Protein SCAR n=3 Tax=Triticum aestivum TaxID=4565 RepID=A0A9R1J6Y1_WHEAT|nr:hypothetical protein CFC21_021567 [Triticum aestivum]